MTGSFVDAQRAESLVMLLRSAYGIGSYWSERWSPHPMRLWFRGVDDASYSLEPGLLREPFVHEAKGHPEHLEWQYGIDFDTRARPYLPQQSIDDWDRMFLMQHYGFPTRLLDWTENLIAAAHFATRDVSSKVDGAVWVLAPQRLLEKFVSEDTPFSRGTQLNSSSPVLRPYGLRRNPFNDPELDLLGPLPIRPPHLDARIIAQSGRFTIHTFQQGSLMTLANADREQYGSACFLQRIIIPASHKNVVRQQAFMFGGADDERLFPSLEGIARTLHAEALEHFLEAKETEQRPAPE